jgi:hypothetical protein
MRWDAGGTQKTQEKIAAERLNVAAPVRTVIDIAALAGGVQVAKSNVLARNKYS